MTLSEWARGQGVSYRTALNWFHAGTPASGSAARPSLSQLKPCELLSPTERSTAGLASLGKDKKIGAARACDWTERGTFGVTITVDDRSGLSDLTTARKTATATKHACTRSPRPTSSWSVRRSRA
jgi:hypothetical protein